MSIINRIIKSLRYNFRNLNGLQMYTYTDSSINIDESIISRSSVDLPLGTETTFIVEGKYGASWFPIVSNGNESSDILYRYIKITLSGNEEYKLITAYDDTTGQITIDSAFGEAITTADEFEIVVLDSIYITDVHSMDKSNNGSSNFNNRFTRIDMVMQTKFDGDKSKIRNFIDLIQSEFGKYRSLEIYNDIFTTVISHGKYDSNGEFRDKSESGDQIISFLGSVGLDYYVDNFG